MLEAMTIGAAPDAAQARAQAEAAIAQADEALASFDVDALVAHLSAAIRHFTAAGLPREAAMACVRLGDLYASALGNLTVGRAWFGRATRLVEDLPPCLEQGWVALAAMGCDVDDPAVLLERSELALDRARRFGDLNLETKALADGGLAHVQAGRIDLGMAMLDEAMALASGPADDEDTAAKSVCSFFTACYFTADYERAGSWAEVLRKSGLMGPTPGAQVFVSSHCDSVQATLLMELGRWSEADALLTRAQADFEAAMGLPSWHPSIALADLRVRQGRLAEAEALLLGKEQALQAMLPAARLHLGRAELDLARATVQRGLRLVGDDRLRAVELLTTLVDVELAADDLDAARAGCERLSSLVADVGIATLEARAAAARARLLAAQGELAQAAEALERVVDRDDVAQLPWLHAAALIDLARLRERAGGEDQARRLALSASAVLADLDVVLCPADAALLDRLATASEPRVAELQRDAAWWTVSCQGTSVRLRDTKGMRYLAELVAAPGVERHALDLVDRIEGVGGDGSPDRRALGDAGELLDAPARASYRRRIEDLRADAAEALERGDLDAAERHQAEIDALVAQLAQAFGLGGRSRHAASTVERARLNVTRALRAAVGKLVEALPEPGAALDRHIRTGTYCAYEPAPGEPRWIVQP